jgi:hypothetical protein
LPAGPRLIIVDGYVWLGVKANGKSAVSLPARRPDFSEPSRLRPGLGARLWEALSRQVPVIGVAKSRFKAAPAISVFRRASQRSLYITSAGVPPHEAAFAIVAMHGSGRMPDLLERTDHLARR